MDFPKELVFQKKSFNYGCLVAVIAMFLFLVSWDYYQTFGVIAAHVKFLRQVQDGQALVVLHPGIYWITSMCAWISGGALLQTLYFVLSTHVVLAFFAAMWALMLMTDYRMHPYVCIVAGVALLFVAPIGIPYLIDPMIYDFTKGNRTILLLRNATAIGLLPYALASIGLCGQLLNSHVRDRAWPPRKCIALAGMLMMSCLIKPSLGLPLIPAIGLYALFSRRFSWHDVFMVSLVLFPAAFMIVLQFLIGFVYNPFTNRTIHIFFDPFTVWVNNNISPLAALLLALVFPLFVLWYRCKRLMAISVIGWIALGVALVPYILLNEVAVISTSSDRDFEWSYLIVKEMLFVCFVVEWWRWYEEKRLSGAVPKAVYAAAGLMMLHVAFCITRLLYLDGVSRLF